MDYVLGGVAALISGNVTPNRPKLIRKALTPTKHPASPNVTPKSEFVEDRSIFLSPTLQKKKAIVKKSPKRIFEAPDLDATENSETSSPKADKVKKHLKGELEAEEMGKTSILSNKSPKNKIEKSLEPVTPNKKSKISDTQHSNETTPTKKKRKSETGVKLNSEPVEVTIDNTTVEVSMEPNKCTQEERSVADVTEAAANNKSKKKNKKRKKNKHKKQGESSTGNNPDESNKSKEENLEEQSLKKKKNRKNKKSKSKLKIATGAVLEKNDTPPVTESDDETEEMSEHILLTKNKKDIKAKSELKKVTPSQDDDDDDQSDDEDEEATDNPFEFFGKSDSEEDAEVSNVANPNAITEKDSDSEHDSDNEIESENEEINKAAFKPDNAESSDEEGKPEQKKKAGKKKAEVKQKEGENEKVKDGQEVYTEDEIKRTLFVGNVPFSNKCKKEIKKIFAQYGTIETVRIRTVPVKDARVTPKLAIIKNEIHPDRSTVNVYIKFAESDSVERALVENNTVLNNYHLRVSRSAATGVEHDPNLAVFLGNLPFGIEDETLRAKFEKCGDIESVRIVRDKKTNAGKGFGYINFTSRDGVELALALSEEDLTVKNRIIRVKRCTHTLSKGGKKTFGNKPMNRGPGKHFGNKQGHDRNVNNQGQNRNFGNNQGQNRNFGNNQGQNRNFGNNQGQNRNFANQRRDFGNNQGNSRQFGNNQGQNRNFGNNQGQNRNFGNNQGQNRNFGNNQGQNRNFGNRNNFESQGNAASGASRRIMNKRPNQESGDGPPNKKQHLNQPREKKQKKEFVGITAEKKKKQKFDKGQKKKKALSEILMKKT